jgi:hypothetical protein
MVAGFFCELELRLRTDADTPGGVGDGRVVPASDCRLARRAGLGVDGEASAALICCAADPNGTVTTAAACRGGRAEVDVHSGAAASSARCGRVARSSDAAAAAHTVLWGSVN